jgi:coenzyme F420-reducing hydrogenase beta subunit
MSENNVCEKVVKQDLCVGCGICAGICPNDKLVMKITLQGGYAPSLEGLCPPKCSFCLEVCPFENHKEDEDSIGKTLFGNLDTIHYKPETGYFFQTYVGYVSNPEHRWMSASGGVATWFLKTLLEEEVVEHVICVTPNTDPNCLFKFEAISEPEQILRSAGSAYYPVEISECLKIVLKNPGRYAVIGLPCFVKGIRLAQMKIPKLKERVVVCAGLTCGGLRTRGFAEALIRKMGLPPDKVNRIAFRVKEEGKPASNYSIVISTDESTKSIDLMAFPGYLWMLGMFKLRACNFCDDIFAELADITFMDAWLPEYANDPAGTSLVITRSEMADRIVQQGINKEALRLSPIPVNKVIESQLPLIRMKRQSLAERLWVEKRKGKPIPRKRVTLKKPSFLEKLRIEADEAVRRQSFIALEAQRQSEENGLEIFMENMEGALNRRKWLYRLKKENIIAGIKRRIIRRLP